MPVLESVVDTIGNTPMVYLKRIGAGLGAVIAAKLEFFNPGGCIKERIARTMIEEAEKQGLLDDETVIIEATSGNTGIGLAVVAAARGYRLVITMPDSMSMERRKIMSLLGAEVVLTPGKLGMQGAIEKAGQLAEEHKKSLLTRQFENLANPHAHMQTTGPEIWSDTDGRVDVLVSGVGTGGTISGTGRFLRKKKEQIKIVAVEPAGSPVLSGGSHGSHAIQGIGAGFIPEVMDMSLVNEVITVSDGDAMEMMMRAAREEGIMCGISSGAALCAACELASRSEYSGKLIAVILPDTGERYLAGL